jgi:hypothetical protein
MSNGWAQFGSTLNSIFTNLGPAGASIVAANPNIVSQITQAAFSSQNPHATEEDQALAQAEALFSVNPALAILSIQKAISLIPPSYLGVTFGLSVIKVDTPPLAAIQAIEMARSKLQKAPGA